MASVDDLWLVDFGDPYPSEPAGHRPAVVLGPPEFFGSNFPFVIVAPLTTMHRGISLHVEVEPTAATGIDAISYIQCELIRSVNQGRLVHLLGRIDSDTSEAVSSVVRTLLNH